MLVNGESLPKIAVYPNMMTVPDCVVVQSNKLGHGHGEAKFYITSKEEMYLFYGNPKFQARCFMLKKDLIAYMEAIRSEYMEPSQEYNGKEKLPLLWTERMAKINELDDVIFFRINDQYQIAGPRGYINSSDEGYQIIRTIALPLVSYIYAEKLGNENDPLFYWKLFVDFDAINERKITPLVFTYGKPKNKIEAEDAGEYGAALKLAEKPDNAKRTELRNARDGQGLYRKRLLDQCHYCPITGISDDRLLIASHIKPWAASNDKEKVDPYNGYMLSPMIDKLFDKGYITFTANKRMYISDQISNYVWKQIGLRSNTYYQTLPMDEHRIEYLKFHNSSVFKGTLE